MAGSSFLCSLTLSAKAKVLLVLGIYVQVLCVDTGKVRMWWCELGPCLSHSGCVIGTMNRPRGMEYPSVLLAFLPS